MGKNLKPGFLFRVDATAAIGIGHLQRCLSLAAALSYHSAHCGFLAVEDATSLTWINSQGFLVESLGEAVPGSPEDAARALVVARRLRAGAVVVDTYAAKPDYLGALRDGGVFVVAIDDLATFPFPCQVVLNPGAAAKQLDYQSSSGDTCFLLGPQYALLRPEFWEPTPRVLDGEEMSILVMLGGADPRNAMPPLLRRLSELPGPPRLTAIVGPYFENRAEIEREAKPSPDRVRLVESPSSMRNLMLEVDLAISGGGQTLYELAATGTPTLAIELAPNQVPNLQALAEAGCLQWVGSISERDWVEKVGQSVYPLLNNREERLRMSRAGQALIDGRGAPRAADALLVRLSSAT